ncbi:MAG: hypothetical protein M3445_07985 [Actinomycetota bacterium]|nr:hypothetical protein [Actinomycetota bacterium]
MVQPGISHGLDDDTALRIARSFLVVRLVRGGLLLLFLAIAWVAVELKNWPTAVALWIALTMLLQAGALVACYRRYVRAVEDSHHGLGE